MALHNGKYFVKTADVVVSGISGVFPQSDNIEELKQNLLSGKDMITINNACDMGDEMCQNMGLIKTLDRFDSSFFRISRKQAECMSVSSRILMEKVFEAILDAGYNPRQFRGTNTGVYVGITNEETDNRSTGDSEVNEYMLWKGIRALIANQISYWLDVRGPSVVLDTACSSGLYALEMAYKAIQNGDCDATIVCTINLCRLQFLTDAFSILGVLSPDGISRPFDAKATGFVRAEAIVATVLQKKQDARRIYANIVHAKTNCDGYTPDGIFCPSGDGQSDLLQRFYQEIDVDPVNIMHIEAHGTGTKVGDTIEVNTIEKIFCSRKRSAPLKIGSVKSNLGHTEASSGLTSLAKVIIAFETGVVPPNKNFKTPHPEIKAFTNGNIEVITKPILCEGKFYAINSSGIGGANGHVLLSPHEKTKKKTNSAVQNIPLLVPVSGRTVEAVNVILDDVEKNSKDSEYIGLWHEIFSENIDGHNYRGYVVSGKENQFERNIKELNTEFRPIWFIFSGMGSQWPGMGKFLMDIPISAESILKSHKLLETKGIDLIRIITDDDPLTFRNIMNSFVGIAAIQIALVDILRAVGVEPNKIIGHSVGELGCAYADRCLTAEQMLLAAYYRGLVSSTTKFVHGSMVAVGAGYDVIKDLVPPEIDIATHNSPTSCTISGPTEIMIEFMEKLKQKDIFVREVNVSNVPYHSRYILPAEQKLISYMEKIITTPKLRSEKWICTSALEDKWCTDEVKYASARYFTNNLRNPVYFEEGSRHIPSNAVTVEIAPHGLLQAILKRSLPSTTDNIALTLRNNNNGLKFLMNALGRIYISGGDLKLGRLYPPIQFPVSKTTPMISPLIKWQHEDQWQLSKYSKNTMSGERDVLQYLKEHEYLRDHIIDDRNLYPATGYLYLVWQTLAGLHNKTKEGVSVVFENVRFERATHIQKTQKAVRFHISVQVGTGNFEISENNATVVSGLVRVPTNINSEKINVLPFTNEVSDANLLPLKSKDFYKILRLRGYYYAGFFKKVQYVSTDGTYGRVSWCNNFVSFMDTMAQISISYKDTNALVVPTFIRKIIIDIDEHKKILSTLDKENPEISVNFYPDFSLLSSGGVQIIDLKTNSIARKRDQAGPVLEKYQFVPYITDEEIDLNTAVRLCFNIVLENVPKRNVKTLEILGKDHNNETTLISRMVVEALVDIPMIQADINIFKNDKLQIGGNDNSQETPVLKNISGFKILEHELPSNNSFDMIIVTNIMSETYSLEKIFGALQNDGFLLIIEPVSSNTSFKKLGLNICFSRQVNANERILLLNKIVKMKSNTPAIKIENTTYSWIYETQQALTTLKSNDEKLIVYAEKEPLSGILGFFNCLRKEEKGSRLRCFYLMDVDVPDFCLQHKIYNDQFEKNLSHNVYKKGQWGSYRHMPLEPVQDTEVDHAYIMQLVPGNFSTLQWVEGPLRPYKSSKKLLVHVYYSALNFRDVMVGAGKISDVQLFDYNRYRHGEIGFEFSGKDENGTRYAGMLIEKGISNLVHSDQTLTWRVPHHMTLEDAATIPMVYATVIYAFFFKINLQKGCSVLIYAGSGGIGQAAINICLHYGCEIFTTVGTPQKVDYINQKFPHIPKSHIGNSRDTSFEQMIMKETKGKGVDVVLNSFSEDKLRASIRCVAKSGHFIEIGKFDILKDTSISLGPFIHSISFHSVEMDDKDAMKVQTGLEFHQKMQQLLDTGVIKPIDRTVFESNQVENAIRFMATGKHRGKVIIKIRNEEDIRAKPSPIRLQAQPRIFCEDTKSYLIIGGLGGFGIELTDWLIGRGAKKIILSSRTGIKTGYQSYKLKSWKSYGVDVVISTEDVTSETSVKNLLQVANTLGPLSAIFNVAVILEDRQFNQQTEETFHTSAGPKAIATLHLDKLSRQMCPQLEHFVVFSSVVCGRGNIEQTNYGMSNSIMERVCETRRADNLPALAIQWGAIGEVGVVADFVEDNSTVAICGTLQQKMNSCLETLNTFMHQSNTIVSSMVVSEKCSTDIDIVTHIANILGINNLKTISLTRTLQELGMDSITAVEVKQVIEAEFRVVLTPLDIKNMTFEKLSSMVQQKSSNWDDKDGKMTPVQSLLTNELMNIPLVQLPSNQNKLNKEIPVDNSSVVFVFPGIECIAQTMELLANNLNLLANNLNLQLLCFQYLTDDIPITDFQECIKYFTRLINDRLGADQEFRIIGYSMGTTFALEVADALEKEGRTGCVWFIDGSPDYIKQLSPPQNFTDDGGKLNVVSFECSICSYFMNALIPRLARDDLFKRLEEAKNLESRKNICLSMLPKHLGGEALVHKVFDRGMQGFKEILLRKYNSELRNTTCTLIRQAENIFDLDDAYGLFKHFKQPVRIHKIENTDHFKIFSDARTAEIILNDDVWR